MRLGDGESSQARATPDYADFAHTDPGTLAGRYLRLFWHPIYRAEDLPVGWAKPIRIMGEDFTLYRGEGGTPHLTAFRCAHRGTQLSTGWVEGDSIRCFYHGWKYDAAGQCVEMPAEDPSFPPKVKLKRYPCEEYLGLVFAYLGDGAPPPLPRYPDFELPGVREILAYTWPCNYFNNLDNGPDEVHVSFVHRESSLAPIADVPRVAAEETDYGLVQYGSRANGVTRVTHVLMPNILQFKHYLNDSEAEALGWVDVVAWRVPVDDEHYTSFVLFLTHATEELAHRYEERQRLRAACLRALAPTGEVAEAVLRGKQRVQDVDDRPDIVNIQDYVALVGQGAIADRCRERLGRSDAGVILLRRIWERELRALAEGRPLKQWIRPAQLAATSGV
ncbi:MAG TPA: Rieske 2Fe-2S domain-containing protein [Chloroflexota bacterium]|jgi:5,5'-dehydrodivanillate O-demethylase